MKIRISENRAFTVGTSRFCFWRMSGKLIESWFPHWSSTIKFHGLMKDSSWNLAIVPIVRVERDTFKAGVYHMKNADGDVGWFNAGGAMRLLGIQFPNTYYVS